MTPQQQIQQQQQQQVLQNNSNLHSMDTTWGKNSLDEQEWKEKLQNDRLSLTLEEIVHIRSVITKAELESLPMGIQIKEDVEKRKLCFLCLRTKFGILGPRGVPCKLCQRTVCAKCYTKMRIPTEHFSNVPVQLLSPSRQNSPSISNAPSPSHHNGMDESFPRSLMERLLRTDVDRKVRRRHDCVQKFFSLLLILNFLFSSTDSKYCRISTIITKKSTFYIKYARV